MIPAPWSEGISGQGVGADVVAVGEDPSVPCYCRSDAPDDMGPGITEENEISDNPGLAIDTGEIYDFDFETGSGTPAGSGGTFGFMPSAGRSSVTTFPGSTCSLPRPRSSKSIR